MAAEQPYAINLDARFDSLELIDVQALVDACKENAGVKPTGD